MSDIQMIPQQAQMKMVQPNPADGKKPLSAAELKKIDEAAQDFEAVYLTEMLRPMFEEINQPNSLFGGGKGEEVFNGMMLEEYGKIMAESGGIGMADHVKAEMIRIQQEANKQ